MVRAARTGRPPETPTKQKSPDNFRAIVWALSAAGLAGGCLPKEARKPLVYKDSGFSNLMDAPKHAPPPAALPVYRAESRRLSRPMPQML
jgi:hypothetical protein